MVSNNKYKYNLKFLFFYIYISFFFFYNKEAKTIIFAELYWTPGIILQAEDRIMRIGQDRVVNVQYLIAKNTSDPYMWNIINNKLGKLQF